MSEKEEISYAKSVIESLARGVNPFSGEMIPDDEVINNVKISRCFFYVVDVLEKLIEGEYVKKEKKLKVPFIVKDGELENFDYYDGGIAISDIVKRINDIVGYDGRKIKRGLIINWLIEDGFIVENEINGRKYKMPTVKGNEAGIYTEERFGKNGNYKVVMYNKNAQEMIIEHLAEAIGSNIAINQQTTNINQADSNRGKPWDSKQEEQLTEMFKDGLTVNDIANTMMRSPGGIRARLLKLGLINDINEV